MSCGKTLLPESLVEERRTIATELKRTASELKKLLSNLDAKI
jgi:hypothetical protein